jgi:hypothetical protein
MKIDQNPPLNGNRMKPQIRPITTPPIKAAAAASPNVPGVTV